MRLLHPTVFPLCTFGYALTRAAAERLLGDIAAREAEGGTAAFDVRLLEGCRDLGLRCWSVAPELMRHLGGGSEIGVVDGGGGVGQVGEGGEGGESGRGDGSDGTGVSTPNLACGVRSVGEGWRGNLDYLRDVVGERGVCLGREGS